MRRTLSSLWEKLKAVGYAVFPWVFVLGSLYYLITGLHSGQVELSGRFSHGVARRATEPGMYWFGEAVWAFYTLAGLFLISLGPWWGKLRGAATSRVQVRGVEAGGGPEPPWVRFPGGLETIGDPTLAGREAMAYFEGVFLPYWVKLSPEAHAAYFRCHPPPDDWHKALEGADTSTE